MPAHKKRIIHNFISLSLVQGLSILFPLISFPYLLRVLGVEGFGLFSMLQTVLMYFDLFVSFGFGLTATQQVAHNLNNPERTRQIISSVFSIKALLFGASLLIFLIGGLTIPALKGHLSLVLLSTLYLAGNLLFPDWYFQGIQKMKNITFVAFLSKSIGLFLLVLLVRSRDDLGYAVLALSAGNFMAGLIGFLIMLKSVRLTWSLPKKSFLFLLFRDSAYVFMSIILAPLYLSVNIFILSAFTNPLVVGYYAIAEKIYSAIGMLTSIANRTFYPHLSQLYHQSKDQFRNYVRRISRLFWIGFALITVIQLLGAEWLVLLAGGRKQGADMGLAADMLRVMSIGVLFSPFVSFFFQLLIIQGQKKMAIRNCAITVLANLATSITLTHFFGGMGMAVNLCITTIVIAALNYFTYRNLFLRAN